MCNSPKTNPHGIISRSKEKEGEVYVNKMNKVLWKNTGIDPKYIGVASIYICSRISAVVHVPTVIIQSHKRVVFLSPKLWGKMFPLTTDFKGSIPRNYVCTQSRFPGSENDTNRAMSIFSVACFSLNFQVRLMLD